MQSKSEVPERIWLTEFLDEKEPHLVMSDWLNPDVVSTQPGDYVSVRPHRKVAFVPESRVAAQLEEARQRAWDKAIDAARRAFDKLPGDSTSYHGNELVNAGAMERRVIAQLEAARNKKESHGQPD
jgi:hypothetical protein